MGKQYFACIESGYKDGRSDLTITDAYDQLAEQEYENIPIVRPAPPEGTPQGDPTYYVPHLCLYPKDYVDKCDIKPKYEATLRVLTDIMEDIYLLKFDFDKKVFDVTPSTLSDKTKTNGKQPSADKTVTITCKSSIETKAQGEIRVYAYPKECEGKSEVEQEAMRRLAGKIQVEVNNEEARKTKGIVLVSVKMKTSEGVKTGEITNSDVTSLRNTLFQMLVTADVEQCRKDKNGKVIVNDKGKEKAIELDLSEVKEFQANGKYMDGDKINSSAKPYADLNKLFREQKKNKEYANYHPVYVFPVKIAGNLAGETRSIIKRSTGQFLRAESTIIGSTRKEQTIAHEVLHALGLEHTHRDDTVIECVNQKYVFEYGYTDNVMSYNFDLERNSTWHWQWIIVRNNL